LKIFNGPSLSYLTNIKTGMVILLNTGIEEGNLGDEEEEYIWQRIMGSRNVRN
jgi:hypothetical protein